VAKPGSFLSSDWAHAPPHWHKEKGSYLITAGTYTKAHIFNSKDLLDYLQRSLLKLLVEFDFKEQAWAVFSNHYHVIFETASPETIPIFVRRLHGSTSHRANEVQDKPGRKVWYQYWDKKIDTLDNWYAKLNYVMRNPVKHGLVANAANYPWCSAGLFGVTAPKQLVRTVSQFDDARVEIDDDY